MTSVGLNDLTEAVFRANPAYELLVLDRLPEEERQTINGFSGETNFYGLLRPRPESHLSLKAVCQETALLYDALTEPAHLPSYLKNSLGNDCNQSVAALVLDGVLEIEETPKQFISGPPPHV